MNSSIYRLKNGFTPIKNSHFDGHLNFWKITKFLSSIVCKILWFDSAEQKLQSTGLKSFESNLFFIQWESVRKKTQNNISQECQIQEENFISKPKNIQLEKGRLFWVTLNQAVVSKTLRLFYKIFFCFQNTMTLN